MAKVKEKKPLEKKNWTQSFVLVGKACVNDYTFKIDEKSNKSDWIYNMINLDVDCGEKYGKVRCELMGGYGLERDSLPIWVHGKDENGRDDFKNTYQIAFEDRFNEEYLEDIGSLCFLYAGIERDVKEEVAEYKFLHAYDYIKYLSEHLENGMEIRVTGQLRYSVYNGNVQVKKEISKIYFKREKDDYGATFKQTILINKDSVGKADKDKCIFPVTGFVLEKFKEYNGNDLTEGGAVKGGKFVPLRKMFEYEFSPEVEPEALKRALNLMFKVKKGYNQVTYEGVFVEGGAVIKTTYDDLTDEIKELVDANIYTLEEALATCTENTGKERRMILRKPIIELVGEEGSKVAQVRKIENIYSDEDFMLDYLIAHEEEEYEEDPEIEATERTEEAADEVADLSWMENLGV